VRATVEPAIPLVPIDTGSGGSIKVGSTLYPRKPPEGGPTPAVQVVTLDRATLAPVDNFTIGCTGDGDACGAAIRDKLSKLGNVLVVTSVPFGGVLWTPRTLNGFEAIGGMNNPVPAPSGVRYSVVGVPGMKAGTGWSTTYPAGGVLRGYATRDTWGNWTYTSGDQVPFDTDATDPSKRAAETSIRVGATTYTLQKKYTGAEDGCPHYTAQSAPPVAHLVVVNRFSLREIKNRVYAVDTPCPVRKLGEALNAVKDNELAFLSDPGGLPTTSAHGSEADMLGARAVVQDGVQRLGGDRDTIVRSTDKTPYALVGRTGLKPGTGLEASPVLSNGDETASRIAGTLTRDQTNGYLPDTSSLVGGPDIKLSSLLYRPLEQWPLLDTTGHKNALAWVEQRVDAGGNLRTDYWQQGWSDAVWLDKKGSILRLDFPGGTPGFTEDDLNKVKEDLGQEITWLVSVRSYFGRLGQPYSDGALASQAELQKIADKIKEGVSPQADRSTILPWLTFIGEVGGLTATIGGFSRTYADAFRGLSTVVAGLKSGIAFARTTQGQPVSDADYRAKVADLSVTLADNIQRSKDALKQMLAIVAGDYGKLKLLGSLGDCSQTSSTCPKEWQLPASTEAFARSLLILQAKRSFYAALLPVKFEANILNPSPTGGHDATAAAWWCGRWFRYGDVAIYYQDHRFGDEPESGFVQLKYIWQNQVSWDILAARLPGDVGVGFKYQVPTASLMNPLFAPVDLTNPTGDNLGLIKSQFFLQTWGDTNRPNFRCESR
jgi:hypothetical protein